MSIETIAFTLLGLGVGVLSMALFGLSKTISAVDHHKEIDAMREKVIDWQNRYAKLACRFSKLRYERDAMRRIIRSELK